MTETIEDPQFPPVAEPPLGVRLRLHPFPLTAPEPPAGHPVTLTPRVQSDPGSRLSPDPSATPPTSTSFRAPLASQPEAAQHVHPLTSTATVNTVVPFPSPYPASTPPLSGAAPTVFVPPAPPPAPVVAPGRTSSPPMSAPTLARFFKVGISAVILLVGSYFTVRSAYPFLKELAQPGSITPAAGETSASVRMLQQTRGVVAKNNANVDRLNSLIADTTDGSFTDAPSTVAPTAPALTIEPLPPQPVLPPPRPKPQIRLNRLEGIVLDEFHVSGVRGGEKPRIMVNGIYVTIGGYVDGTRRLRFMSLDEERRVVVLGDDDDMVEKYY